MENGGLGTRMPARAHTPTHPRDTLFCTLNPKPYLNRKPETKP